jgi:P4 family phage/plasmid primase-like protien
MPNFDITIWQVPGRRGIPDSARGFTKAYTIEPGDTAALAAAVSYDNCLAEYEGGYRTGNKFKRSNVVMADNDNTHSDDPADWIQPADIQAAFPGVMLYQYPSRNNMKEKDGRTPRPKFHNLFVIEETTDKAVFTGYMTALIERFPELRFDKEVKGAAQLNFGVEGAEVTFIDGEKTLTEFFGGACQSNGDTASESTQDTEPPEYPGIIPKGNREQAMFDEATRIVTRYGDTPESRAIYDEFIKRLEVIPKEADPPQPKAGYFWARAQKHYHDKTEKRPGYKDPKEFNATAQADFNDAPKKRKPSISYHVTLSKAYISEHRYIVGVQKLCKGGYGNDTIYEYRGGIWVPCSDSDVKSTLAKCVISAGSTPDPKEVDKAYRVILMSGKRKDIEEFNGNENLVCFQNGVYRLSDGAKLEHSPEYYFTFRLNANIPDEIQPTPYCDMCIGNFGDVGKQTLLYEFSGGVMSNVPGHRFKKALLQYGKGDAGKTQLKNLVERIVGAGNYNNVDLSDLENNRFLSAAFQPVRVGGSNDMSNVRIREEKIFKQLTGGDSIQAENKGEKGFTFRYKGFLWFLANNLPLFGGDKGEHVYNRWIVFYCENSVPPERQIKDLCDRMFEERDSFCIKALQAFQRAVSNNYTFTIPESCKAANAEYQRKNSTVRTFITECCKPLDRDKVPKEQTTGKLWAAFKEWTREGNYYLPGKSEFIRELAAIAGVDEKSLIYHTKDGNYYPYILTDEYIKELSPFGVEAL